MDELVTNIGVPGIILLLVFKMLVDELRSRNGNGSYKNCVTREEFERHKSTVQYKDNCEQIVKRLEGHYEDIKGLVSNRNNKERR